MNQGNYFSDILYNRRKLSTAIAGVVAALLIVLFFAFGGQETTPEDQQQANTETTQQTESEDTSAQTGANTQTTQQPSENTTPANTQEPAEQDNEPEIYSGTARVSYTGSGFAPESITVRAGTTVYFTNNSNQTMRVESVSTSNSTQAYAFFQQPSTLSSGDSYMFVFNDPGTLFYHNLNRPMHTGTVIVVE